MDIRDPIHGAIVITPDELAVVDHPFIQRLRNIRATGFSHFAFPGATHSRYSHSIGTMHLAGLAFDHAYRHWSFPSEQIRERFRSIVRIAALCHDLGHAPFSHSTEFAMPLLDQLEVPFYPLSVDRSRRANHEDYTAAILGHPSLSKVIAAHFPFEAHHVAALISRDIPSDPDFFHIQGRDHRRILSQLISSELDVDRLDYLRRDSYFTGVQYGQVDTEWILGNLAAYSIDESGNSEVTLALDSRAIYAFDHFLIARHHMYLMVYFHHKSVVYEEMLKRYVTASESDWKIPANLNDYLYVDDISLECHLRATTNPWARRIIEQQPYQRVVERHGNPNQVDLTIERDRLFDAGIGVIYTASTGKLSRYENVGKKRTTAPPIVVLERMPGQPVERVTALSEASDVFSRYADERRIARLYVAPENVKNARAILGLKATGGVG